MTQIDEFGDTEILVSRFSYLVETKGEFGNYSIH